MLSCEGIIFEDEVFKSLKFREINKWPRNDRLSKELFEYVLDEVTKPVSASIHKAFLNQELNTYQGQLVIKIFEKRDKDKRLII